jgi:hypothetical protein
MPTGLHPVPFAERSKVVGEPLAARQRVEKGEMRRIHAVFLDLQPIARPDRALAGRELVAGQVIGVEDREIGLRVGRPHIGEHQPMVFVHRIGAVEEAILQGAVRRLARRLEDRAVDVEEPAVIAAADPLIADQTKFERGPAMRAVQFEEAHGTAPVAERDEILAQNTQAPRQVA